MPRQIQDAQSNKPLVYPVEFKQRVLALLPAKDFSDYLEKGSEVLGRYLDDLAHFTLRPQRVLEYLATPEGLRSLRILCQRQIALGGLYQEWLEIMKQQRGQNAH